MAAVPAHTLIESFLYNAEWTEATKNTGMYVMNGWHAFLTQRGVELVDATRDDARAYLAHKKGQGRAQASLLVYWTNMRALHRWLYEEGEAEQNPWADVTMPKQVETPVEVLSEFEYKALLRTCDRRTTAGRRDEAMMSLMWWSGLRRDEVVKLDVASVDFNEGTATLGARTWRTKTGKIRRVPLSHETKAALDRYLRRRGKDPGPLFLSERGDEHTERRLHPNSLHLMLARRSKLAGLERPVRAHEFRRAFTIRYKMAGGSDPEVMAINGWSSMKTLERYQRMMQFEIAADQYRRIFDTTSPSSARRNGRRIS